MAEDDRKESRRAGLETSSSSTVGAQDHLSNDLEAFHADKATASSARPLEETDDEKAAAGGRSEAERRKAIEGDFPEGGFRAWAGVASTALCMVSPFAIAL